MVSCYHEDLLYHQESCFFTGRFFEPSWITPLLESSVALNMLYIEVVSALDGKEWFLSEENRKTLTALKKAGKRKKVCMCKHKGSLVKSGVQ